MSSQDQQLTKKLAEMKSFLERRIRDQENEVNSLKTFLEVVDSLLAERSFRPVEIPASVQAAQSRPAKQATAPSDSVPVLTVDGVRIAGMSVDKTNMDIIPEPGLGLDANSAPLRSFLLGKVLDPMQAKDKEAASTGTILPENIITYNVEVDGDKLKAIRIQNYGDDRRLLELKNAVRWTLRRMYENATAKK